ncbi:HAMP domain-containing histidine kinase [Frankia sp. AgB1.9]|uniref:sensor histidine kinase n=1 Tax=unclassified Frankia TaxID=2632575 RepID=UPI001932DBDF|nr:MULTISPECIES: HAMP domain-containing sensor histidine kinase [unclassified Frankia]MBL7494583.1 HAMP domain-containing histidine kinase [Frankia sp. AgW1.1]MBL7552730.1 HAMP domain-containing histidine kinase [Frankia sp. AgB1.9]MBL7625525.1 HAMP domain-containing histidine kinase [Frankia sp. AgB1.8]
MRGELIRLAIAVTSMVALAFLVPLALIVAQTAHDRALAQAERTAAELGPAMAITTDRSALERALAASQGGADGLAAVHVPDSDGTLTTIGPSRVRPDQLAVVTMSGEESVVNVPGGSVLLGPVAVSGARIAVVEVFVPGSAMSQGVRAAWLVLGGLAVTLVAISVLVADRLGNRMVRATRGLAFAARRLGAGDLNARVPASRGGAPPEVRDAAVAFNAMADRVRQLVAAERELAADLSHRLRTPLTVLRLNTAALGGAEAADQVQLAVDRLEHEVDQIIRAARDRGASGPVAVGCDAAEVVRDRVDFWSVLAEDQGRPWRLAGAGDSAQVPVARAELAAALDALLGNVFHHTGEGVAFAVALRVTAGAATIRVADAGPGIADPAEAMRRGAGAGGAGSTGLGLDIARRVATSTGGELTIGRSRLGGADIRLRLRTGAGRTAARPRRQSRRQARRHAVVPARRARGGSGVP